MKARIRVPVEIPHAEASSASYATESAEGRLNEVVALSSSSPRFSNAAVTSSSAPRPEMSKALAAFARTVDPSPLLVFGLEFSSCFADPALTSPSLAVRLGMKRSAALCGTRIVVFPVRDLRAASFLALSFDGVWLVAGPVPVNVKSETPRSRCLGDCLAFAMFDFGDCW